MSTDRKQRLEEGRAKFQQLSAKESGVRHFSEATRENDAETYNSEATLNAFESTLGKSVHRLGEVAKLFQKSK